jgi:carboxymethylenebutenolidase
MAGSLREISSNGGTLPAYVSVPEAGGGPGVVVIQEWWGLVDHIKDVADRFAAEGFVALAPDLYHGESASNTEPDEAARLLMELRIDQAARDMAGAVDALLAMLETTGDGSGGSSSTGAHQRRIASPPAAS